MFDAELTAMASESYERAYGAMTLVQQLTELEEAVEYKCRSERRAQICVVWSRRLQGCRQNIEQWQRLLLVRYASLFFTCMYHYGSFFFIFSVHTIGYHRKLL